MSVPQQPVYRLEFLPAAAKQLRKLPRPAQRQLAKLLDGLAVDPRPPGAKALTGIEGVLRVRSGNYRVIYEIAERKLLITVIALGDRRDVSASSAAELPPPLLTPDVDPEREREEP